jgi:hypothetical protein
MSAQAHLFAAGRRYRVKKDFIHEGLLVKAGEVLVFIRDYYDFHDESSVYEFRSEADAGTRWWSLYDTDPVDSWRQSFEPLDA